MKSIILFTVSYPYGSKEQFLETEVKYLSQAFKEVIIIPNQISGNQRGLPANVRVDTQFAEKNSNIHFLASGLLSRYLYKEIIKFPFILLSLTRIIKLLAFVGKGVSLYKYLKNNYQWEYIFYSYWFNGSVFGCYLYNEYSHKIDFFSRVHGSDIYLEVNKNYLPLRSLIFPKINKIFSISRNAKDYLLSHYAINENKIQISRLGTQDQNIYTSETKDKDSFNIVSCSHLSSVKRLDLLIKALSLVSKENQNMNIHWAHIGSGEGFKRIKSLARELSSTKLHLSLLGEMSNMDIYEYYKTHKIDLFVNVSRSEGIPVTFMEAFSCSIPVLAIDNGGVSEIVDNKNGILLKHETTLQDLVLEMSRCLNNKDSLVLKKTKAKSTWEKSYNAEVNYMSFCKKLNGND